MVSSELLYYFALHPLSPFEYRNNNILGEIYIFFLTLADALFNV